MTKKKADEDGRSQRRTPEARKTTAVSRRPDTSARVNAPSPRRAVKAGLREHADRASPHAAEPLTPTEREELERLRAGTVMRLARGKQLHLDHLKAFCQAEKRKSFTAAAEHLGISHQALAQRIHKLQAELGVQLFEPKAGKRGTLTSWGHRMVPHFAAILDAYNRADAEFEHDRPRRVKLRLGVIEAVAHSFLPSLLEMLRSKYSEVALELTVIASAELAAMFANEAVDLTITAVTASGGSVRNEQMRQPMRMVFVGDRRLYPKPIYDLAEIVERGVIAFQPRTPIHRTVLTRIEQQTSNFVMHTVTSITAMIALLQTGYGVATLPEPVATIVTRQYPNFGIIEIRDEIGKARKNRLELKISVNWRAEPEHPRHAAIFRDVRAFVRNLSR